MSERARLGWSELPRSALRNGAACAAGGARIMLLAGEDRRTGEPRQALPQAASDDAAPSAPRPEDAPR
jgi:hypothetical protein